MTGWTFTEKAFALFVGLGIALGLYLCVLGLCALLVLIV